jgi:hypothetical protein
MALTGVLGADFSAFTDAVASAEIKLRSFDSGASKVNATLNRMGDSFSGRQVIQDATLMAKVFDDMGGAAAFTEKELARMNATATEAVAKLQAMGKDVPEGIRRVAEESEGAGKATESWSSNVKTLAAQYLTFQAALAAGRAAMDFVKGIVDQAGALVDLSAQTRISVEELQVLQGAMKEFGVEGDQVGKALFKLSKQIAGGEESVAATLDVMGLSLEKVRGMKGEELFIAIQNGLAGLQGGLRDTAAIELYGEKLGMIMSGAAEGSTEAIAKWREMNKVMSEESAQALDAAGERWDRLGQQLTVLGAETLAPLAEKFLKMAEVADKSNVATVGWAKVQDMLTAAVGNQKHFFDDLAKSVGVETEAKKQGTTATQKSAEEIKKEADAIRDRIEARKKEKEALEGWKDFQRQTAEAAAQQPMMDEFIAKRDAAAIKRAEDSAKEIQEWERKQSAGLGYMNMIKDYLTGKKAATEAEAAFNKEQEELIKKLTDAGDAHTEAGDKADKGTKKTKEGYAGVTTTIEMSGDALRAWIALQQFSMSANAILNRNSLFTTTSQLEEMARMPIPGRAAGGPVSAGQAYIVGEQGPELFIPGASGAIAAGGAGPVITNIFHLVDTESNLARRVSDTIMRQVRAGTQLATT